MKQKPGGPEEGDKEDPREDALELLLKRSASQWGCGVLCLSAAGVLCLSAAVGLAVGGACPLRFLTGEPA